MEAGGGCEATQSHPPRAPACPRGRGDVAGLAGEGGGRGARWKLQKAWEGGPSGSRWPGLGRDVVAVGALQSIEARRGHSMTRGLSSLHCGDRSPGNIGAVAFRPARRVFHKLVRKAASSRFAISRLRSSRSLPEAKYLLSSALCWGAGSGLFTPELEVLELKGAANL